MLLISIKIGHDKPSNLFNLLSRSGLSPDSSRLPVK